MLKSSLTPSLRQSLSEYQLQQLVPPSVDACKNDGRSVGEMGPPHRTSSTMHMELSTKSCSTTQNNSISSFSKCGTKSLFSGPPPPIAASIMIRGQSSNVSAHESDFNRHVRKSERSTGFVMSDRSRIGSLSHYQRSDSVWPNLRRRQRILEDEVQQLLDFQSSGLLSGLQLDETCLSNDLDHDSDAGSSTPTGTFHSTVTSRSRMQKTLYLPPRSTQEGNIVPVRQPAKAPPLGLGTARNGLRTAIESLRELRREEKEHIVAAIMERKAALQQLDDLSSRRLGILSELTAYESDGEELLARELRELDERHSSIDQEISRLEEQLTGLRRQRQRLRDQMRDIQGKREAGLSGYRGALRDVDSELNTLMRLPPVLPLDPAVQGEGGESLHEEFSSAGGPEFLSLNVQRRRPELARAWWEAELTILEKRSLEVDGEMQALDEGSALWRDVSSLISSFESDLRQTVNGKFSSKLDPSAKSKGKAYAEEESIRHQVEIMGNVLSDLEHAMKLAESKKWNLLICAIGAELEAFREALDVLTTLLPQQKELSSSPVNTAPNGSGPVSLSLEGLSQDLDESHADESNPKFTNTAIAPTVAQNRGYSRPQSQASENEVPLEFLAEHDQKMPGS
ncbi:hypothetical protein E4U21_003243 [Claviceps maximensis]|nr:hypothetical protein E4U21_003243 [Claviceps maximensis]